jgi:hypothetical protein
VTLHISVLLSAEKGQSCGATSPSFGTEASGSSVAGSFFDCHASCVVANERSHGATCAAPGATEGWDLTARFEAVGTAAREVLRTAQTWNRNVQGPSQEGPSSRGRPYISRTTTRTTWTSTPPESRRPKTKSEAWDARVA